MKKFLKPMVSADLELRGRGRGVQGNPSPTAPESKLKPGAPLAYDRRCTKRPTRKNPKWLHNFFHVRILKQGRLQKPCCIAGVWEYPCRLPRVRDKISFVIPIHGATENWHVIQHGITLKICSRSERQCQGIDRAVAVLQCCQFVAKCPFNKNLTSAHMSPTRQRAWQDR